MEVTVFLFVNGVKIYQYKAKDFEKDVYPLCLRNFSKNFTVNNMKKLYYMNMCLIRIALIFILDSHKYLIKKHDIK